LFTARIAGLGREILKKASQIRSRFDTYSTAMCTDDFNVIVDGKVNNFN
jgi:hypothetical protein